MVVVKATAPPRYCWHLLISPSCPFSRPVESCPYSRRDPHTHRAVECILYFLFLWLWFKVCFQAPWELGMPTSKIKQSSFPEGTLLSLMGLALNSFVSMIGASGLSKGLTAVLYFGKLLFCGFLLLSYLFGEYLHHGNPNQGRQMNKPHYRMNILNN